jgi:hypothetical protein
MLTSYVGAVKFFFNARELIQEGYEKVSSNVGLVQCSWSYYGSIQELLSRFQCYRSG